MKAPRRGRSVPLVVCTALGAAVLVLVVSVVALRSDESKESSGAADGTAPTGDRAPAPTATTSPVDTAPVAAFAATAETTAREWIRAVAVGDGNLAWELLADASRQAVGGRSGFDDRLAELAEDWDAWEEAPGVTYRTVRLVDDGVDGSGDLPAELPRLAVVVVAGRGTQEGADADRATSLPVRGTKEEAQVDPFVEVGIELDPDPAGGGRIGGATVLGAYIPALARVWFILDDRSPVGPDDAQGADGDQQHVTFTPAPALAPGRHTLTVVVLTVDGRVASRSQIYRVV